MSDAFKNYDSLINSMASANQARAAALAQYHQTKASTDSQLSILGDTKMFLSSKPAAQAIYKNILKPKIDQLRGKVTDAAKRKAEQLASKANKAESAGGSTTAEEGGTNTSTATSAAETEMAPPPYAATDPYSPPTGASDGDVQDLVAKGSARAAKFEDSVSSGEAEGSELTANAASGGALAGEQGLEGAPTTLAEWSARPGVTGFSQAKTSFSSGDIGESGEQSFDRATGLSGEEQDTVDAFHNSSNVVSSAGKGSEAVTDESMAASRAGTGETAMAKGMEKGGVKTGENIVKKTAVEDGVEEGTAEAGLGVLDAIPFADILGLIGGAVLAGVEGHKSAKEAKEELGGAPTVSSSLQIGAGGSEANQ